MSTSFPAAQIQAMKDHGGLILNISSVYAYVPSLNDPIYATSKGGYLHIVYLPLQNYSILHL